MPLNVKTDNKILAGQAGPEQENVGEWDTGEKDRVGVKTVPLFYVFMI